MSPSIPEKSEISEVFEDSIFNAGFFVDGAYDFKNGNWKSGDEIIQDSEWAQSEDFTYGYVTYLGCPRSGHLAKTSMSVHVRLWFFAGSQIW